LKGQQHYFRSTSIARFQLKTIELIGVPKMGMMGVSEIECKFEELNKFQTSSFLVQDWIYIFTMLILQFRV